MDVDQSMVRTRLPVRVTFSLLMIVCVTALALGGCARVPRERTLPPSIRSVSVPMFVNRTAEPGLEEIATVATQREFLADGRLNLVRQEEADAIIRVTLTEFEAPGASFDSDDFPRMTRMVLTARVEILQNIPTEPVFGGPRVVVAREVTSSDKRRITFEPEPRARDRLAERLAREIVREVLTGRYTDGD